MAVYVLEKQHVHFQKVTYLILYHTYLLATLPCIPATVHIWLAGLNCVFEKSNISEQKEIGMYILFQ